MSDDTPITVYNNMASGASEIVFPIGLLLLLLLLLNAYSLSI
jgi:hypothetical protein